MAVSFLEDLKKKELIPIKILMFIIYGGQATLYPYFALHLETLGIGITDMAIIFAVQPIVALLVMPLVGALADKIGNFKLIFCFFLVFSSVSAICLQLTPAAAVDPPVLVYGLQTTANSNNMLHLLYTEDCTERQNSSIPQTINLTGAHCDYSNVSSSKQLFENSLLLYTNNESYCSTKEVFQKGLHFFHGTFDYVFVFENVTAKNCSCFPDQDCANECKVVVNNISEMFCQLPQVDKMRTFWIYLCIRLVVTLGIGMVNGLFDASSMVVIQKYGADVGLQRLWATLGMCIFAPVSGYFVNTSSASKLKHDYSISFYMYGGLYTMAAFVSTFVDLSIKKPSTDTMKHLARLFTNPEVLALFFFVSFLGICWGFLENFLFLFLENELDADTVLMGLTVTVGSATGLPMAIFSTWVSGKVGYVNILVIAYFAYVVRFLGYSFASSPLICLVYETMENFTVTLLTIGVTMYCSYLAPLKMLTTMMTIWNSLHFITGRSLGSLIGGFLTAHIGSRRTFRVFAYGCSILGTIYAVLNIFYLSKRETTARRKGTWKDSGIDEKEDEELRVRATSLCNSVVNFSESAGIHTMINMDSVLTTEGRRHSSAAVQRRRSMDGLVHIRHTRSFSPGGSQRSSLSDYRNSLTTVQEEGQQSADVKRRHSDGSIAKAKPNGIENPAFISENSRL